MIMRFKQIGLFLLLLLGFADAFAGPGGHRGDERGTAVFRLRGTALEREEPRSEPPQSRAEQPHAREFDLPDNGGYGARVGSLPENPPRQWRMTPEERRALRRQIDEVGHDIYAPRR